MDRQDDQVDRGTRLAIRRIGRIERDQLHHHHLNMRAPGMTMHKVPLFVWSMLVTAFMLFMSLPVLAGAVTMLLTDRNFGTTFFSPRSGL